MNSPEALLQQHWGYDSFRPHQKPLIAAALKGKDCIGVLPTGGGKSICYQIPALAQEGLTLVISPLIALMEDQITQLHQRNIRAMSFSSKGDYSIDQQFDNAHHGKFKLLYLSPERLNQEQFIKRLSQLPIHLVAVDEAHCISEWGHDFRPAYRKIARLREQLPDIQFMAVTATATPKVIDDIQRNLNLAQPKVIQASFKRENIAIEHLDTVDKMGFLQYYLKGTTAPTIVYTWTRKSTEQTASLLQNAGIKANYFHGGLTFEEKQLRLEAWKNESLPVMVATAAFGMGIDKSNVRNIIHLTLPESLESYYQQIGRAGRDGQPSKAILLKNENDKDWAKRRTQQQILHPNTVKKAYKALNNYLQIPYGEGSGASYTLNFSDFCKHYELPPQSVWAFLSVLEKEGICNWKQQQNNELLVRVLLPPERFTTIASPASPTAQLVEFLSRTHHDLYHKSVAISPQDIAKQLGVHLQQVQHALQQLQQLGGIDLSNTTNTVRLHFLAPRADNYTLSSLLKNLKQRNKVYQEKLMTLLDFVFSDTKCKQQQLLAYFGEDNTTPCEQCTATSCCTPLSSEQVQQQLLEAVQKKPHSWQELQALFPTQTAVLVSILHHMEATGHLFLNPNQQWDYGSKH